MRRAGVYGLVRGTMLAAGAMLAMGTCCLPVPPLPPDKAVLQEADRRAKLLDPDAIIVQASGVNGASLGGSGSETLAYTFLAVVPGTPSSAWELRYDKTNWEEAPLWFPPLGMAYYDLLNVTMTEAQARKLIEDAGFTDNFYGWTLHQPLTPAGADPVCTMTYADKTLTINTRTQVITVAWQGTPPAALPGTPGEDSVSLQMIAAADTEIKKVDPTAFIIWCGGRDGTGQPLQAPGDTNVWNFHAVALGQSQVRAWWMTYDGAWTVEEKPYPPLGFEFIDLTTITMDVVQAWNLAVQAGYTPPFDSWVVFKALHPLIRNPNYVFPVPGKYIIVDSVTGEVSEELR